MLECAASIFDFQFSCKTVAETRDSQEFRNWRKLKPRYLKVYDFLRQFFQSEQLALRTALPLKAGPKRRANQASARVRKLGRRLGTRWPIAAILRFQNSA
jgi:hypothetical protein